MATLTKSTGTVTLTGAAEKVTFPAAYGWVWVKNMSEGDIFAGLSADISEGADGVMTIPAGECGRIQADGFKSVYLLGTGNAHIVAQNYADCPFQVAKKGGDVTAGGNPVTLGGLQGGVPFSDITLFGDIVGQKLTVNACGKNLLNNEQASVASAGVTITKNSDGTVTLNGISTADVWLLFTTKCPIVKDKAYTFSSGISFDDNMSFGIRSEDNTDSYMQTRTYGSFVSPTTGFCRIRAYAAKDTTFNNLIIRPQLEIGSTATPYEPYSGSTTTITPDSNPYTVPNDIRQQDGYNVVSVSAGEISVTGVRKNAAVKKIWDKLDELATAIIVSNGEI